MMDENQTCPHCGARLQYVGDAFCPECRNSLDVDAREDSAGKLDVRLPSSAAGWLLPLNVAGFVIIAVSFLPALGICHLIGDNRDGTKLAIGGMLSLAIDLLYRFSIPSGHWLLPNHGGKFFFLPVWMFGIFWTVYGVKQLL